MASGANVPSSAKYMSGTGQLIFSTQDSCRLPPPKRQALQDNQIIAPQLATVRFGAKNGTGRTIGIVRPYIRFFPRGPPSERHPPSPLRETARPTGQDFAVHTKNLGRPLDNKLLAALPRDQFDLLAPHLTTVSLEQAEVLAEPGDEFDQVYFPQSGMLSLLAVLRDGKAIETATVGREGVVGAMAGLGLYKSLVRVVVQLPMMVSKIPASQFRKAAPRAMLSGICVSNIMKYFCLRRGSPRPVMHCTPSRRDFAAGYCNPQIAQKAIPWR